MTAILLLALTLGVDQPVRKTYTLDSLDRIADIYAPSKATQHPPLVFAFHGHGGNARNAERSFHVEKEWPEAVVVYMQGLPSKGRTDPEGTKNGWQIGLSDLGGRDLAFFDAVYQDVTKDYNVDLDRVYAMGHSNGGRFTYVLWAARGDLFAAFGPSGSPSTGLKLKPKPAFHIAGETDPIVPFAGQKFTVENIKRMDGCSGEGKSISEYATLYKGLDGNDVVAYFHPEGHTYPTAKAPAMIVDFFKSHVRKTKA